MQQPWPLGENLGKGFPRLSRAAVEADGLSLKYLPADLQADVEVVSKAVRQNGLALQFAADELRGDRKVVLRAVSQNGDALRFASPPLRRDAEVVLKAATRTASALRHAPVDLWEAPELLLEAIRINPICMSTMPLFQDDEDFVLQALSSNGMALQHVSKRLQRKRNTALAAVMQNGLALQFAHPDLRADSEVVLPAVAQNGNAFCWASRLLRNDPNVAFQALALNGTAINHLGDALRSDANQVILQVTRNEGVEEYTAPYVTPPWGPLDTERHREVVLRWLARRWNVPGWKSLKLPARDLSQSLSPLTSSSDQADHKENLEPDMGEVLQHELRDVSDES